MTEPTPADLAAQTAPPGLSAEEWKAVLRSRANEPGPKPTPVPTPATIPPITPPPDYGTMTGAAVTIGSDAEIKWVSVNLVGQLVQAKLPKLMDSLAMASAASTAFRLSKKDGDPEKMSDAAASLYDEFAAHVRGTVHPDYAEQVLARLRDAADPLDYEHINEMIGALQELASREADLPPTSPSA